MAWFGPNYYILGSVGNASWHWGKVQHLSPPILIMLAMFAIASIGILVVALSLKCSIKISYFDGYMHMQKKYWLIMAVHEAYALNEVRILTCLNIFYLQYVICPLKSINL